MTAGLRGLSWPAGASSVESFAACASSALGGPFAASPTFEDLCETVDGSGATRTHDHTSVYMVFRFSMDYEGECESVSDGNLEALRPR